jgi:hypothetical protein
MSVPFLSSVAVGAVEALTDQQLVAAGSRAVANALQSRFPDQHPLLVGEHLHYAGLLVRSASELAAQVQAGSLSQLQAMAKLQSGYSDFPSQSVERALTYGLQGA